ncbi:MAG: tRNA (N6-isopentenyl adenosine(37)-C2)-methylthiotransferase MiaB [Paraperlucidibaca sp.]|nr:tRNA (N6-isopentenyl adenosine(37)-C2)-methylthiotransferase MiaB [Paraperlucidibaca sp.]|tara:strand:- start:7918 stop:9339 length:1422 start_codon:yes stop_codon:yes gene_type:complete
MARKLYIETQGCQMNEYDSSRMLDLLSDSHQLVRTNVAEEADVLLLNTCSIREKAQEKVFSQLGRWQRLKLARPEVIIGVGGCVASQEGEGILQRAPYVDMVFGPQTLHRLPQMLNDLSVQPADRERIAQVDVRFPENEKFDFLPEPRIEGHKAFVSIMEGCSKYCSFCVVPYTRGEEVSRPFDDVIAEVAHIARQGVREVTLLGQNVNGYYGEHHDGHICGFAELLRAVAAIPGIGRIRYTTSHPLEFNDALIQAHADVPELAAHVHLPVQSGSNRILAAMKRNHEIDTYKDTITRLKAAKPGIEIASDFIIGFPNETEEDFEDTLKLIEFVDYDHSYSFIYSKRPGTPAAELPDSVSHVEKKQRLQRLQTMIARNTGRKTDAMMDTEQRVLIDRESKRYPGYLVGIAENTRWIHFPGDASLIGRFATLKISGIESINALRAEAALWVESDEEASIGVMPIPGRIPLWHAAV